MGWVGEYPPPLPPNCTTLHYTPSCPVHRPPALLLAPGPRFSSCLSDVSISCFPNVDCSGRVGEKKEKNSPHTSSEEKFFCCCCILLTHWPRHLNCSSSSSRRCSSLSHPWKERRKKTKKKKTVLLVKRRRKEKDAQFIFEFTGHQF